MSFVCDKTGKKATGELIVFPGELGGDPDGIGVIVTPDGKVTNRWGDGTIGLSAEVREAAAEETEAYAPHTFERHTWKHPKPRAKRSVVKKKSTRRSPGSSAGLRELR